MSSQGRELSTVQLQDVAQVHVTAKGDLLVRAPRAGHDVKRTIDGVGPELDLGAVSAGKVSNE
ncbi:MAG TPA: hypothetical protein PKB06_10805 [Actinotalea sp.]|nr:hypothetical protein [Actinotalea sp.]